MVLGMGVGDKWKHHQTMYDEEMTEPVINHKSEKRRVARRQSPPQLNLKEGGGPQILQSAQKQPNLSPDSKVETWGRGHKPIIILKKTRIYTKSLKVFIPD